MADGSKDYVLPPLGHAISGAGSSALALFLIYPLDTIKTRLQVETRGSVDAGKKKEGGGALAALRRILAAEGISGLYAGLATNLANQIINGFVYFYAYSILRRFALRTVSRNGTTLSTGAELAVGAVAGMANQLLTLPIGVIATRQQTAAAGEQQRWTQTVADIVQKEGVRGLWAGFRPAMVLCVNPAITYGVFEKAKASVLKRSGGRKQMSAAEAFWVGALAKTLATVVTYPYIMAKVRLQWRPSREEAANGSVPYKSAADVLGKVLRTEGPSGWFRGMQTQIIKAVITQALMLMIKESFTRQVTRAFMLGQRGRAAAIKN